MNILIVYGTTEGQTRRICRFCADHLIARGHSVELMQASGEESQMDLSRFDAAIVAASVHLRVYQSELAHFVAAHAAALSRPPTLFLSVSLASAGGDPEELADLDRIAEHFFEDTGWRPGQVAQVAGAFRFTQYDFLKSWAMRWIAVRKGRHVDPHADTEYTDWAALRDVLDGWMARTGAAS
ncbi:protoporphyrinogen oxidase [Roseovarius pacificus]|uniref:Protoporphyrinogen oxidase n=1 Tax=Roseovarius pacificus TaxID=337701 RepID=A0A1M7D3I5_9RHOB|nr:flavodoxin domain-containing protein [Roseovarius pacificus]GGO56418.1 hypothetical protein GCM10011315_21200 [Roseovarius pacificus]SHL73953.1 protoporphyrinogen oxidase [Roseovarius pacificus]